MARLGTSHLIDSQMSPAEVPVLVMVTPVNEFSPACAAHTFRLREDARPHTLLGSVVGTDMDYPRHSIEYHTSGEPTIFAVDRLSGTWRPGLGEGEEPKLDLWVEAVAILSRGNSPSGAFGL